MRKSKSFFDFTLANTPHLTPAGILRQHPHYAALMQACGVKPSWLIATHKDNDTPIAQWLILHKRRFLSRWTVSLDSGVFTPEVLQADLMSLYPEAQKFLRKTYKGFCALGASTRHRRALALSSLKEVMTTRHDWYLDLTPEAKRLRANLAGKWRNALKKAEKANLTVHVDQDADFLKKQEREQRRERGYFAYPAGFDQVAEKKGYTLTLSAHHNNLPIAAIQFLLHPPQTTYHLGWNSDQGKIYNAHNLLLWEGALQLKALGFTGINFGTVASDHEGLRRFKSGTGAVVKDMGSIWG